LTIIYIYIYIYIEREREREREMIRYWIDPGQLRLTCKISTQVMRPQKNNRKQIKKILKVNSQSTDCWRMKLKKLIKKEQKNPN
jgi:hypothetical protein